MAFDALEIIIIGIIAVVIFMWGPSKIPELARALGRARKEFTQASKEITSPDSTLIPTSGGQVTPAKSADDILVETARQLGIKTEGKTREEISQEIIWKSKAK